MSHDRAPMVYIRKGEWRFDDATLSWHPVILHVVHKFSTHCCCFLAKGIDEAQSPSSPGKPFQCKRTLELQSWTGISSNRWTSSSSFFWYTNWLVITSVILKKYCHERTLDGVLSHLGDHLSGGSQCWRRIRTNVLSLYTARAILARACGPIPSVPSHVVHIRPPRSW